MKSRRPAAPDGPLLLTLFLSVVFKLFPRFIKPFHFQSCFPRPRFPHEVLNAQDAARWVRDAAAILHGTELKVSELDLGLLCVRSHRWFWPSLFQPGVSRAALSLRTNATKHFVQSWHLLVIGVPLGDGRSGDPGPRGWGAAGSPLRGSCVGPLLPADSSLPRASQAGQRVSRRLSPFLQPC